MSVVEDVRQVFQDFLAPELRAISARLEALEKTMDARMETVEKTIGALEKTMDARFAAQNTKIEAIDRKIDSLKESLDLDRRLSKLEAEKLKAS
jgi:predicted  nucleic acid-binding Zn-ribbon protein